MEKLSKEADLVLFGEAFLQGFEALFKSGQIANEIPSGEEAVLVVEA